MSDRIISYTVILDTDYKDEDAEEIEQAIRMIKGVSQVILKIANPDVYFAVNKAKLELREKLINILYDKD